jgi:hypothetical protein
LAKLGLMPVRILLLDSKINLLQFLPHNVKAVIFFSTWRKHLNHLEADSFVHADGSGQEDIHVQLHFMQTHILKPFEGMLDESRGDALAP